MLTVSFDAQVNRRYAISVGRAFAGALLFSLPILMTMEMWSLGHSMDRLRLALLMVVMLPLLVGLAYYCGFEDTVRWRDAVLDAFAAMAIAATTTLLFLLLFTELGTQIPPREWLGKIALQAVPGSIGALLAQSQFGRTTEEDRKRRESGDLGEYFIMCVGALFLSANIAPTEEVVLIAAKMTPWHAIALLIVSLGLMHAFVYRLEFRGQHEHPQMSAASIFLRYSLVGYAIALIISAYMCWTFGRFDDLALEEMLETSIVLGLPAAVGAALARLVL